MARQQDVEPLPAFVASLAAMADAARYTRAGARTAGRRAASAGTAVGRRAWARALDSNRRARVALRVYRGEDVVTARPARYVAIGAIGAVAVSALSRAIGRAVVAWLDSGPDSGRDGKPGEGQARLRLAEARATAERLRRRGRGPVAVPPPAAAPDSAGVPGNGSPGVTVMASPGAGPAPHRHRQPTDVG